MRNGLGKVSTHLVFDNSAEEVEAYIQEHLEGMAIQRVNVQAHEVAGLRGLFGTNSRRVHRALF
jgi:hypothetical protein